MVLNIVNNALPNNAAASNKRETAEGSALSTKEKHKHRDKFERHKSAFRKLFREETVPL